MYAVFVLDLPCGVSLQDLQFICTDWDIKSLASEHEGDPERPVEIDNIGGSDADEDDWLLEVNRPAKKRKLEKDPADFVAYSHIDFPLFDDPLQETAKIARKINID